MPARLSRVVVIGVAAVLLLGVTTGAYADSIFATDNHGNLYSVTTTGAISTIGQTKLGSTTIVLSDIAICCTGGTTQFFGIDSGSTLYAINPNTAALTSIGPTGNVYNALAFANGTLYAAGNSIFSSINTTTGAGHVIGNNGGFASSGDLVFTGSVMLETVAAGTDRLATVNLLTGIATLGANTTQHSILGLCYINGVLYGFNSDGWFFSINPTSGGLNYISQFKDATGANIFFTGAACCDTPQQQLLAEPGSVMLLLSGLTAVGLVGRRRWLR